MSQATVLLISLARSALVLAAATFAGLWAAGRLGLDAPLLNTFLRRLAPLAS